MRFSHFFVDRPIFAAVISIVITLIGGLAYFALAGGAVSGGGAAHRRGLRQLSRRLGRGRRRDRGDAARAADQRRREHALHGLPVDRRRQRPDHHHLRARHRPRRGAGAGPEPGVDRRAAAARGGAPARHHDQEELARPDDGDPSQLAGRVARPALHLQLRHAADQGRAGPPARRRRHPGVRRARLLDAHLAQPRAHGRARSHRHRRRERGRGPEHPGRLGQPRTSCRCPNPGAFQLSIETLGRLEDVRQFENIIVKTDPDGRITRVRDVARVELGAQDYLRNAYLDDRTATALGIFQLPGSNALATADEVKRTMEELRRGFPPGPRLRHHLQPDRVHPAVGRRGGQDHLRGGGAGRHRRDPVPADLARGDHPDRGDPGLADRHLRRHVGAGLQPQQPVAVRAGARDRHRRRRRDRRGRERRAQPAPGPVAQGRRAPDHGRGRRRAARHRAGALRGVHPGGADLRHPGPVLPPVRGHHRRLDADLVPGLADPFAGLVRAAAQAARGAPEALRG